MAGLLPPAFYLQDTVQVARALLGCLLVRESPQGRTVCRITETEAYCGPEDRACHSYQRRAPQGRTNMMYQAGGHSYIYLIYGMYNCFNVVTRPPGDPQAVLIRSGEPLEGIALMTQRRTLPGKQPPSPYQLLTGPGKLCQGMDITRALYGEPLWGETLYLLAGEPVKGQDILAGPRINVAYAGEDALLPYRFGLKGSRFLSQKFQPFYQGAKSKQ